MFLLACRTNSPGNGQAFPARSRFFHLPLAKWLPHVTSARCEVSYFANFRTVGINRPDVVSDRPPV